MMMISSKLQQFHESAQLKPVSCRTKYMVLSDTAFIFSSVNYFHTALPTNTVYYVHLIIVTQDIIVTNKICYLILAQLVTAQVGPRFTSLTQEYREFFANLSTKARLDHAKHCQ